MTMYSVGHSTRSLDDFIALLRAHNVVQLADVRTIPKSRRHPHFSREALDASLAAAGIAYRHYAALGGLRRPRPDSRNSAWRHEGFRGYADYMESGEFEAAVDALTSWASGARTAVMCAEAMWWQCHRRLLADSLAARGIEVRHIMSPTSAPLHEITAFARIEATRVSYPGLV